MINGSAYASRPLTKIHKDSKKSQKFSASTQQCFFMASDKAVESLEKAIEETRLADDVQENEASNTAMNSSSAKKKKKNKKKKAAAQNGEAGMSSAKSTAVS